VPIVRTVATVMAGVGRMRYSVYVLYSIIGAIIWTDGVLLLGYWLGHIKFVRDTIAPKIDLILVAVVILSVLPTLIHLVRSRRTPS
jgi:membrane-associated protein